MTQKGPNRDGYGGATGRKYKDLGDRLTAGRQTLDLVKMPNYPTIPRYRSGMCAGCSGHSTWKNAALMVTCVSVDPRLERERAFQNKNLSSGTRSKAAKFYAVTKSSRASYLQRLRAAPAGAKILEYGCGAGSAAIELAAHGFETTGIDISDVAIQTAKDHAKTRGLEHGTRFEVMNAERLSFPEGSFDLVCGTAILHHLDLSRALPEIARVLKPGGSAVFVEPLGHNPAIRLYRTLTPTMRTRDEHPLKWSDIESAGRWFGAIDARPFHMLSLLAVVLRTYSVFETALEHLDRADAALFGAIPYLRRHAWCVLLELSDPTTSTSRRSQCRP